ncbi:DUF1223 domain-containing protein [Bosea sp. (in: a-proteobacteria)]|jgi:hypothetical protein|uniref:DUF1223 domain-containing protein n=1 Tax=Bosea sp. (in: a-proteobacteria) TaxID=1871050 RepID=UPI003F7281F4
MIRRRRSFAAFIAAILLGAPAALAENPVQPPKAVLELFTSQGCSSCPAADALFVELAKDPDLITLTMPVTYWDYLGWKDTLGQEAFSKRQKLYAKTRGDGQIYTPQAVINGAAHMVGSNKAELAQAVQEQASEAFPVAVALTEDAGALRIQLSPARSGEQISGGVWVVPISRLVMVPIERGENKGRSVSYANVVRGLVRVGDWSGTAATLSTPLSATTAGGADSYVVLVQADQPSKYGMMPGAILGAARAKR